MKRILACLLVLLISLAVLISCSKKAASSDKITVTVLWQQLNDRNIENWNKYIIGPFEKAFPNIHIDFQPTPNWMDAIRVQLSAGRGPDLFMTEAAEPFEFFKGGRLVNLNKYVEKYSWDKLIFGWALKQFQSEGVQFAIPHSYEGLLYWYNEGIYSENNVKVPTNRAEFVAAMQAFQSKGITPVAYGTLGRPEMNNFLVTNYLNMYSGPDAVAKLLRGELKWTDTLIMDAMRLMNADWQAGYYQDRRSYAVTNPDSRSLFFQGRAATLTEGTWIPMIMPSGGINFNLKSTYVPSMRNGVISTIPIGMGAALCINANTKEADAAAEFINFMYNDEENIMASVAAGEQPLCRPLNMSLLPTNVNQSLREMYELMDQAARQNRMSYTNYGFFPGGLASYVYEDVDKVFVGDMTVEEYCANCQRLLDQAFTEGWESYIGDR